MQLRYLTGFVSLGLAPTPISIRRSAPAVKLENLPLGQLPLAHSTEYELSQTVKTGNI